MMKPRTLCLTLAALLLGAAITFAGVGLLTPKSKPGSGFIWQLTISELTPEGEPPGWEILQDATYTHGRAGRVSRRIVVKTKTAPNDVQILARNLDSAIEQAFANHGATQTGEKSFSHASISIENTGESFTSLYLPRYHYRAGVTEGVVDAWVIGTGSGAAVIISLAE